MGGDGKVSDRRASDVGEGKTRGCSDKRRWRGSARRTLALDDDGLGDGGAGDDGTRGGRARATGGHGAAEPEAAGHPAGEEGEGDGVSARSIGRPKPRAWGGTSAMEKRTEERGPTGAPREGRSTWIYVRDVAYLRADMAIVMVGAFDACVWRERL